MSNQLFDSVAMPVVVGGYKLVKTLGQGAFSKVKYAIKLDTQTPYAIKVIAHSLIEDKDLETQVRREIEVMAHMDHPNLIKLHEVLNSPSNLYLVLDLAEGGELFGMLAENGPLPEARARKYFQQVIDAIAYMHSRNITHRDLKPENILLDGDDQIKVADFGLSILSQHMLSTCCGTPCYTAPEVFTSSEYAGPPADVWGCGCILYVMLAALLPFNASTLVELEKEIVACRITYPKKFPIGARNLLQKVFVTDPKSRITIPQIRADPWFAVDYVCQADGTSIPKQSSSALMDAFTLIAKTTPVSMDRLVLNNAPGKASTTFSSVKPVPEIQRRLTEAIGKLKGKIEKSKHANVVKAVVPAASGPVAVKVEVIPVNAQTALVEVCRIKGVDVDFVGIYRELKAGIG
jgi:serine/threonine protein kinase